MTWSQKLATQREMRSKGAALIYDRMKILLEVFKDEEFLNHCMERERNAADLLDEEVADTCTDFLSLKCVIEYFPDKAIWQKERLDQLVAKSLEMRRKKDNKETHHAVPSWKERYTELKKKFDSLEHEHAILRVRFEEVSRIIEMQSAH